MSAPVEKLTAALADRYHIERELGQGGMATVYLAADLKHDRQVAVKVLRPELAAVLGAERFVVEIKTTAALQHPHILPLFDSGEAEGFLYYVMPFIEGETLRDKLNRERQLGIEEAVRITCEAADALDYAHRHGIIHRDVKPENILLHDGRVMVADFGIALAVSAAAGGRMTETGLSLGTPQYMSPEQATADRVITARSDVYSLGCVLYEMLAGQPPHAGGSTQQLLMKIIADPVAAVTTLRKSVPPNVAAALAKALEKVPADRFDSAKLLAEALRNPTFVLTAAGGGTGAAVGGTPWKERLATPLAVAAALLLATTALGFWGWSRPPVKPVIRYGLALPADQALRDLDARTFDLAPDGSWMVYVGPGSTPAGQLWVKAHERYEARALAGTAGAIAPAVSPDGLWITFNVAGQLRMVPTGGGPAATLADSVFPPAPSLWLDDGTVVYLDVRGRLRRVTPHGGVASLATNSDSGLGGVPTSALPDGRGVLVKTCDLGCVTVSELWVVDLRSGESHLLFPDVAWGSYIDGLLLVIGRDGEVLAVPLDLGALTVRGTPVPILDGVKLDAGNIPDFALSASGSMAYLAATANRAQYEAVWVSRDGAAVPVDTAWTFDMGGPVVAGWALSPDERRLAIGLRTGSNPDIWIKELDGGPVSRLTFSAAGEYRPRWTPDGRALAFLSDRLSASSPDLYVRHADGTGEDSLVLDLAPGIYEASFSPDQQWLLLRTGPRAAVGQSTRDIVVMRRATDTLPVPLLDAAYDEMTPMLSPDGRWLAYVSTETGRGEVYVGPFPRVKTGKWQISTAGGVSPIWSRSGRELFFVNAAREMVSRAVLTAPSFQLGPERVLFPIGDRYVIGTGLLTPFDIGSDGRFLMVRRARASGSGGTAPLIVVENWIQEVKQRMKGR